MSKNFEDRYLDLLESGINSLRSDVKANTRLTNQVLEQAKKTNGRVTKLEKRADAIDAKIVKRWPLELDTKTVYIIAVCFLIVLVIIAKVLKVQLSGVI